LFDLKYDDFTNIFKNHLFKGVLIVTAEFFTNKVNRKSIMRIKTHILKADGTSPQIYQKDHALNEMDDIEYIVNLVIDKIITDYGSTRRIAHINTPDTEHNIYEDQQKPIIMSFDVYNKKELHLITSKLKKVKQIDNFQMAIEKDTRYRVSIYTNASEYELAEGLYLNNLSYKVNKNSYNLIDIVSGR